jgi:hypothetical protein
LSHVRKILIAKRILVVADERPLRQSRVSLLEAENWVVESAGSDDDAMELLLTERFDLILLGRNSSLDSKGIDQRIREKYGFGILKWPTSAVCFGPPWAKRTSSLDLSDELGSGGGVGLESQGGVI